MTALLLLIGCFTSEGLAEMGIYGSYDGQASLVCGEAITLNDTVGTEQLRTNFEEMMAQRENCPKKP